MAERRQMRPPSAWLTLLPKALAISLGLAAAEGDIAGRVRGAQIGAIVRLTPLAMTASCLNALILLVTLGHVGALNPGLIVWGCVVYGFAAQYLYGWLRSRRRGLLNRPASIRAIRRAILNGAAFGALWGVVPVMVFAGAQPTVQLVIGCLTAGMMCAGGFVLATVPLAGISYVGMILAGATYAVLSQGTSVLYLGLIGLLWVYAAVVMTNLCYNAHLFVVHFLAEARLQTEILARERAQAQVAHAQRMTALGELAGGIAHDFNNILQSVAGNASLMLDRAADAAQTRQLAGTILDATERGGAITRRLLAFARQDTLTAEPVDVGALLSGAARLLGHTLNASIALEVAAEKDLPRVLADKAQLETILVNLAANARDAMPAGGMISLSGSRETVAQDWTDPPLRAGVYVRITITDTGTGMDPRTLSRATDPFFTTKPKGKGTGLGLSIAKGFAEQSGGALGLASESGQGTAVTLWLPQTDGTEVAATPETSFSEVTKAPPESILIVDDDDEVRETLLMSLDDAGFSAIGADSAAQALALLGEGLRVDALITDFSMPGMNGIDLVHAVHARTPGLPAILLTGHVEDVATLSAAGDAVSHFTVLQKPIRPRQLTAHIRVALMQGARETVP